MSYPYQATTWLQAEQAIALRLNDTANLRWTQAENYLYLTEALRVWNCLTQQWLADWAVNYTQPNPATLPVWNQTGNSINPLVGSNPTSPRTQTLTDASVYTVAQYHLLEPPTGNSTWIGSSQFTLSDFTQALQRRRDQILQRTQCYVAPYANTVSITPNTNRFFLPDSPGQSVLDLKRIRYIPAVIGSPATLWRDDSLSFEYFENAYEQEFGTPLTWDVIGSPPQTVTVDKSPDQANNLDILAMLSGGQITPPTPAPLLMPDDWSWGLKFGMMADLLGKDTESSDPQRAAYCMQRFSEFMKLATDMPWLTQARINNVTCDTPSVEETDASADGYEWQSNPNAPPLIVRGGVDLFAVCPVIPAGGTVGVLLTLVQNAPIPTAPSQFIQCGTDVLDAVIDEAQHLAMFKDGYVSLQQSMPLHQNFIKLALEANSRLRESGIFETTLRPKVSREDEAEPRYAMEKTR